MGGWEHGALFDEKVKHLKKPSRSRIEELTVLALEEPSKSFKHVVGSLTHSLRKAKPPSRRARTL